MLEHTITVPNTTAAAIYQALLSSDEHTKIIVDTANVSDVVGDTFTTFSGYASGKNVELVPGEKLCRRGEQVTGQMGTTQPLLLNCKIPKMELKSILPKLICQKARKTNSTLVGVTIIGII